MRVVGRGDDHAVDRRVGGERHRIGERARIRARRPPLGVGLHRIGDGDELDMGQVGQACGRGTNPCRRRRSHPPAQFPWAKSVPSGACPVTSRRDRSTEQADAICSRCGTVLHRGTRAGSLRRLAGQLTRHTGERMQLAERLGRLGTETAFAVSAAAADWAARGNRVYPFHLGDIDLATPANIVEAMNRAIAEGKTGYCPAAGIAPLREALAANIGAARGHRAARRQHRRPARRQAGDHQVHPDPDEPRRRRALPESRVSDLREPDRLLRRPRPAVPLPRDGERLRHRPRPAPGAWRPRRGC